MEHTYCLVRGMRSTYLRCILRGRCSAGSISRESGEGRRRLITTLQDLHFAWQAQHLDHLSLFLRGRRSTGSISRVVWGRLSTIDYIGRMLFSHGRCSTSSTSAAFCVVGAEFGAQWLHFGVKVELFGAPFQQLSGPNLAQWTSPVPSASALMSFDPFVDLPCHL